jgi:hypothetical protein
MGRENDDEVMELARNGFYIGDKMWAYEDGADSVRLYSDGGTFVTAFQSKHDMMEYLYHAEADKVNKELAALVAFRTRCKSMSEQEKGKLYEVDTQITEIEKEENRKAITKRVRMLRGDMTNWEFGKIVGLNGGTIYNLVSEAKNASANTLKRVSDRCGVSMDWLLGK